MVLDLLAFKAVNFPIKNLMENGDFEKYPVGRTKPNDWYIEDQSGYTTWEIRDDISLSGSKSLKTNSGDNTKLIKPINFIPGNKYYFLMNVYRNSEINQAWNQIRILTTNTQHEDNTVLTTYYLNAFPLRTWQKREFVFTAGTNDTGLRLSNYGQTDMRFDNLLLIDLTATFGAGNEPTKQQIVMLLEQFPNSWFDGTQNIFNAKHFLNVYHKKITELENAITALGGGS